MLAKVMINQLYCNYIFIAETHVICPNIMPTLWWYFLCFWFLTKTINFFWCLLIHWYWLFINLLSECICDFVFTECLQPTLTNSAILAYASSHCPLTTSIYWPTNRKVQDCVAVLFVMFIVFTLKRICAFTQYIKLC